MSNFKEIVTKAVVGKGKLTTNDEYTLKTSNNPSTILGCWVINHTFHGTKENDSIKVIGSYDINIWYSTDNNTKTDVVKEMINYENIIPIELDEDYDGQDEIVVRVIKQPNCVKAEIGEDSIIKCTINKTIAADLVGDAKIRIDLDSFGEIGQDNVEEEINNEVNDNFLN